MVASGRSAFTLSAAIKASSALTTSLSPLPSTVIPTVNCDCMKRAPQRPEMPGPTLGSVAKDGGLAHEESLSRRYGKALLKPEAGGAAEPTVAGFRCLGWGALWACVVPA